MAVRSPHLHTTLRAFALGAFAYLLRRLEEDGDELPFAFEEHVQRRGPALYEFRPLVRDFVEARAHLLRHREDAQLALAELAREPAATIFARAHAGPRATEEDALFRTVLLALLTSCAEACGGFDWDDAAFERAYAELERSLFAEERRYGAVAPLVGISVGAPVELAPGIRVRAAAAGELAKHWPEASGLLPPAFGRELDRSAVIEVEQGLPAGASEPPDAPGEIADAVSAIRLATGAPACAGPVLFERLDWRPFGIRPVPPIAAMQPPGEPDRLDSFRGGVAREVLARLTLADEDERLAEALDRWELGLFQGERAAAEQSRGALEALLGSNWPLRTAMLVAETPEARERLHERLAGGDAPADVVRRALVEALRHGDRRDLVVRLDKALLGIAPPPRAAALKIAS